ncbi:hypothetical protein ACO0SA_000983 [Hanseniaspora valbyensis]
MFKTIYSPFIVKQLRFSSKKHSGSSGKWLSRHVNDEFTQKSIKENYLSRAAYKLLEINEKYNLFTKKNPQKILDLGMAPGAWSQVARKYTHPNSIILGVDLLDIDPVDGVDFYQGNILFKSTLNVIRKHFDLEKESSDEKVGVVDVVMSDMYGFIQTNEQYDKDRFYSNIGTNKSINRLQNISGITFKDHMGSVDLCDATLVVCLNLLKPGGTMVCKILRGEEEDLLKERCGKLFDNVYTLKPAASRNESKEYYLICKERVKTPITVQQLFSSNKQ